MLKIITLILLLTTPAIANQATVTAKVEVVTINTPQEIEISCENKEGMIVC